MCSRHHYFHPNRRVAAGNRCVLQGLLWAVTASLAVLQERRILCCEGVKRQSLVRQRLDQCLRMDLPEEQLDNAKAERICVTASHDAIAVPIGSTFPSWMSG
jgi:hypothetical protein